MLDAIFIITRSPCSLLHIQKRVLMTPEFKSYSPEREAVGPLNGSIPTKKGTVSRRKILSLSSPNLPLLDLETVSVSDSGDFFFWMFWSCSMSQILWEKGYLSYWSCKHICWMKKHSDDIVMRAYCRIFISHGNVWPHSPQQKQASRERNSPPVNFYLEGDV